MQRTTIDLLDVVRGFNDQEMSRIVKAISNSIGMQLKANYRKTINAEIVSLIKSVDLIDDYYYIGIVSKVQSLGACAIMIMDMASGDEIIYRMTGDHINLIDSYKESALQELANITIGSFASQVSRRFNCRVDYTIPLTAVDLPTALLDSIIANIPDSESQACLTLDIRGEGCPLFLKIIVFGGFDGSDMQ